VDIETRFVLKGFARKVRGDSQGDLHVSLTAMPIFAGPSTVPARKTSLDSHVKFKLHAFSALLVSSRLDHISLDRIVVVWRQRMLFGYINTLCSVN